MQACTLMGKIMEWLIDHLRPKWSLRREDMSVAGLGNPYEGREGRRSAISSHSRSPTGTENVPWTAALPCPVQPSPASPAAD
ncbi:uncharacterized protein N7458_012502 [Penicillium daleae]|uniref:Uncharacterized protein n=1 Tax=Penicillium daleae TaxID=63821 RepID=A0AAD6BWJ0_9EURO|nr:uncharacterized protein N7458_012502 [Penicillium daleae]KAJ5433346.1 hypothetical protein N7458_012502 [Penicillium daleae]